MRRIFLNVHKNGNVTTSNYPIQDGDAKLKVVEIEDAEYQKVMEGKQKIVFVKNKIKFEDIPPPELSLKQQKRKELKEKMNSGNYTNEDIVEALKLIL